MRPKLLYNPRLLCERLAVASERRRRLARLKGTPGGKLSLGHIDSLELLELVRDIDVRVIYDVGANVGTWTLLAKSVLPHAHVHAFEPLPKHCDAFSAVESQFDDVLLHRVALDAEEKHAKLLVTDFSDASSILSLTDSGQSAFGVHEVEQFPLRTITLDHYRETHKLSWPDLIKLDVQGYELEVLKGARECLKAAKAVLSEVSFIEYYEGQCLFHDVASFLADAGLFVRAFGFGTPIGRPIAQTDVLFMRSGNGRADK
jgi:FkbM family methyltransferase